jgi:hypothetical protein
MTKYPTSTRRLEFLTHLAARSLYRTEGEPRASAQREHESPPSPPAAQDSAPSPRERLH